MTKEVIKKFLEITRNKKKKCYKFFILAKSKLNSIHILIASINLDINHEKFRTVVNEKEKCEKTKKSIRMAKSNYQLSENNKNIRENNRDAVN